ncbi:MAG: hypothetical protein IH991_17170, partial [Planctomycetes bacterium]|nr:hypothetical protein [Planctomycetota bacterium]
MQPHAKVDLFDPHPLGERLLALVRLLSQPSRIARTRVAKQFQLLAAQRDAVGFCLLIDVAQASLVPKSHHTIGQLVKFRQQNLLTDRFEQGFDLILCRNVVI